MTQPLLEARGISRTFGHVQALKNADLNIMPNEICALIGDNGAGKSTLVKILSGADRPNIMPNEICALIGDNGAGKSTLVKILSGADRPNSGELLIDGRPIAFHSPLDAQAAGIATVYQDLALAPDLTPAENLFLGREIAMPGLLGAAGFLNRRRMRRLAQEQFEKLGVRLKSARVSIDSLSGGQRQSVAIARAAMWAERIVILDEPTAALGVVQTQRVLDLARRIRDEGTSVVMISHNMPQVLDVADRIQVLRLGERVAEFSADEVGIDDLVRAMTSGKSGEKAA